MAPSSAKPPRPRWPTRRRPATTPTRSSSRAASSCARSCSPLRARPSVCPHCPHRRLPTFREFRPVPDTAHIRHGSNIGQPLTRREGVLKVTGAARYAADNHPPGMLHAVLAVSSIARGRVASLDVEAAKPHRRVVEVLTPANVPPLAADPDKKKGPFDFKIDTLQSD